MSYGLQSTKPDLQTIVFNSRSLLKRAKASGDTYTYGFFWKLGLFLTTWFLLKWLPLKQTWKRNLEIRTVREITKYVFPLNTSISIPDNDIFEIMPVAISELLTVPITLSNTICQRHQFVPKGRHAWIPLPLLRDRALEWYNHRWWVMLWGGTENKVCCSWSTGISCIWDLFEIWKWRIISLWISLRKEIVAWVVGTG